MNAARRTAPQHAPPPRGASRRPGWEWLLVAEFLLVSAAWQVRGFFRYDALLALTVVLVGCAALFGLGGPAGRGRKWRVLPAGVILAGATLYDLFTREALLYPASPQRAAFLALAALSVALLAVGWTLPRRRGGALLVLAAGLLYAAFLATQLHRSPRPIIDTWVTNSEAVDALLAAQNPYTRRYSNVYEGTDIKPPDYPMLFNYLPGLLLHYVPGKVLAGDIRWSNLAGIAAAMTLFALLVPTRRGGVGSRGREGPLPATAAVAVVLFFFHGGQVLVLEQAWPEAWLLLYLGLALWFWERGPVLPALFLVLALGMKQTAWFCAPFLLVLAVRGRRWRLVGLTAAGVTALFMPFLLWEPQAFIDNVFSHFLRIAPRPNALSWSAACLEDAPPFFEAAYRMSYVVYAAALAGLVFRLRRLRGGDPVLETHKWMTVGLLALFLFLKQSFFNYYYVVGGLLAFTFCLAGRPREGEGRSGGG